MAGWLDLLIKAEYLKTDNEQLFSHDDSPFHQTEYLKNAKIQFGFLKMFQLNSILKVRKFGTKFIVVSSATVATVCHNVQHLLSCISMPACHP